jgi:hypothetical protein
VKNWLSSLLKKSEIHSRQSSSSLHLEWGILNMYTRSLSFTNLYKRECELKNNFKRVKFLSFEMEKSENYYEREKTLISE